jgi:prepilin-type N-terminal cleavage/methylation domain-containing protein
MDTPVTTRPAHHARVPRRPCAEEAGFSLLEVLIALIVLLIVATGVLPLGVMASKTVENQGHLTARTTEYAQDKLEQLLALAYGDSTSDTRVFPSTELGGSGLTVGGSTNPAAPVNLYVDYLDLNGNLLPVENNDGWFYQRVWQVSAVAGRTNLKQVSVTATVRVPASGGLGTVPLSTVTALKTGPF